MPYPERPLMCNNMSEVEHNCSNSCPATCEDPGKPVCRNNYCWRGCECRPGYVKEHQNWTCIPVELCPKCGVNEHFRDCGTNCEPTCTNYQNTPPYCNNKYNCKRGCFCDFGFVRDMSQNGTCVPVDKCPQKCGPNEYFEEAGTPCVRTAANPRPKCLDEPTVPACVCNTGFRRNQSTGQCEQLSSHVESCGGNETFSHCGTECARKCFDETKRQFCPTICLRGCFCNEGYVRDSHNQKCVLSTDCYVWRPENRKRRTPNNIPNRLSLSDDFYAS
ncbi:unnamed protein product [Oppiella nova]|uniref:TIL domain-containing protein n=1 Tax=Oppiella nova TaxID=334625 RepID=A0A7R9QRC5_9ACAR|nr:unnamed protein product [Oppiella nova]CAG2172867.1 unnamed protein product [Oppiella nova]